MYAFNSIKGVFSREFWDSLRTLEPSLQESAISEFARFKGADFADRLS
jgi:hypothetical protein